MNLPHRVFGIVFSAGGLEPLLSIVEQLPQDSGSAFIVLQHAGKSSEHILESLLAKRTGVKTVQIADEMVLEADVLFVGPPGEQVAIENGKFVVSPLQPLSGSREPLFDHFFASLAASQRDRAVGVVLSGAGADARKGGVAIRQAGGLVLVQDPVTANFRSMPEHVQLASGPDLILDPARLADMICALACECDDSVEVFAGSSDYQRILGLLQKSSGIDFSRYKPSTVQRRITRRMMLNRLGRQPQAYIQLLEASSSEATALSRDLLIGVSSFLRDPGLFSFLRDHCLAKLVDDRAGQELRIWVAGCATGEEAYSYAMVLESFRSQHPTPFTYKILASDINPQSIAFANAGLYPKSIEADVPSDWLERYFAKMDSGYQFREEYRHNVIFFHHDMIEDIPFTNIDVISCRNVFIYFNHDIQKSVSRAFGFALRQGGLLILSPNESLGAHSHFALVNEKWRVHRLQRKPRFIHSGSSNWRMMTEGGMGTGRSSGALKYSGQDENLRERLLQLISTRYVPLILVINTQAEILYILGDANGILQFSSGELANDLSRLADPTLRLPIQSGIKRLSEETTEVSFPQVPLRWGREAEVLVDLRLARLPGASNNPDLIAVLFERTRPLKSAEKRLNNPLERVDVDLSGMTEQRIHELEEELFLTQQSLRTAIEELESTNEELQAANEEMQSGNEELQSTNEELQSTNEELITVNSEYQEKLRELSSLNDDINNLMAAADVATVFIDQQERLRLSSPAARKILHIIDQDVGRPIAHLKHRLLALDLLELVRQVLKNNAVVEMESSTAEGEDYCVRAHPFVEMGGKISGVVLNFIEITHLRDTEKKIQRLAAVVTHNDDAIILTNDKGIIVFWNGGAEKLYGWSDSEAIGMTYRNLIPEADLAVEDEALANLEKEGACAPRETRRLSKSGQLVDVWISYTPIYRKGQLAEIATIEYDVSERIRLEKELRLAAVAFNTVDGIMITDSENHILRVNKAFMEITGFDEQEVVGHTPSILNSGRQDTAFYEHMWQSLNTRGEWTGEIWNRRKNGEIYPELLSISVVKETDGTITHYIAVFRDIREKKAREAEIHKLAYFDPLTTLPNRRLFSDRLEQSMATCQREGTHGALLFLDLDRFKTINDSLGHGVGDRVLQKVAYRLRANLRAEDTVARLGGDEFVIILMHIGKGSREAAAHTEKVAQTLLQHLDRPFEIDGHSFHTSASIGVTVFPDGEDTIEDLLRQGDNAMYLAKKRGRNRVCFFDPSLQQAADSWLAMERALRLTLEAKQFQLYYQPLIDERLGCMGAEALIRWQRSDGTQVSPSEFIPICEETGMIVEVGTWVLREACRQFMQWRAEGLSQLNRLAVNISPRQFAQDNFVETVISIVKESGISASLLELEVTENLLLEDPDSVIRKMSELRAQGIRFAIDDFGTGYSSLAYLKRLPINKIKIDRSFVNDLFNDDDGACIVESIVAMGQKMQLELIAEGVESREQAIKLKEMGCTAFQGYFFARPQAPDAFKKMAITLDKSSIDGLLNL